MEDRIGPKKQNKLIKEIYLYRSLIYFFVWRDLKIKYKQTLLGFTWIILQPALLLLVFYWLNRHNGFQVITKTPYLTFLFSGLIIWSYFSSGFTSASQSILNNANIIKKIYFPRIILPLASILVSSVDLIILILPMSIMLLTLIGAHAFINFLCLLPLTLLSAFISTLGISLFLATLNVRYRDFKYITPFLTQFLFFISPVFYSDTSFTGFGILKVLFAINPLYSTLSIIRVSIGENINYSATLISSISAIAILGVSIFLYKRNEQKFADQI